MPEYFQIPSMTSLYLGLATSETSSASLIAYVIPLPSSTTVTSPSETTFFIWNANSSIEYFKVYFSLAITSATP
ncbi:hypothetical protein EI377_00010 [Clostridium septicum]|nr:hypothetical protein EI377_00010 [Clostridium septicum]